MTSMDWWVLWPLIRGALILIGVFGFIYIVLKLPSGME